MAQGCGTAGDPIQQSAEVVNPKKKGGKQPAVQNPEDFKTVEAEKKLQQAIQDMPTSKVAGRKGAYIFYSNDTVKIVRDQNPDMAYKDVVSKVG